MIANDLQLRRVDFTLFAEIFQQPLDQVRFKLATRQSGGSRNGLRRLLTAQALQAVLMMEDFRKGLLEKAHLSQQVITQDKDQMRRRIIVGAEVRQRVREAAPRLAGQAGEKLLDLVKA